jgi:hypothetical protein
MLSHSLSKQQTRTTLPPEKPVPPTVSAGTILDDDSDEDDKDNAEEEEDEEDPPMCSMTQTRWFRFCKRVFSILSLNALCETLVQDGNTDRIASMYELLGLVCALLVGVVVGPMTEVHSWIQPPQTGASSGSGTGSNASSASDAVFLPIDRPAAMWGVVSLYAVAGFSMFDVICVTVGIVYIQSIPPEEVKKEVHTVPLFGIPVLIFVATIVSVLSWVCAFLFIQLEPYAWGISMWFTTCLFLFFIVCVWVFGVRLPGKLRRVAEKERRREQKEREKRREQKRRQMGALSSSGSLPSSGLDADALVSALAAAMARHAAMQPHGHAGGGAGSHHHAGGMGGIGILHGFHG